MQLKYFTGRIQVSYLKKGDEQLPGKEGGVDIYIVGILGRKKANISSKY